MPTFGDFETFGEPLAISEDRGHVSTVWRARKAGEQGDPKFAIKCYTPQRGKSAVGRAEDTLENDPAQKFLAGIKQLQKTHREGVRCLVPIHDFGFADEGVWYVTDFYPRNTLKAWIARRGGVDSAALQQVVHSLVTGCLALKNARGFPHGNLKAANVFLVGKPRPLRRTPLHLADAYPSAPLQLSRLPRDDRHVVDELLHQVIEVQDLRALGELLLQLVEGRLVTSAYDYNYPIAPSPAWEHLGAQGERWRELCNRLLDPQLSLEKVNLELLAQEFRPTGLNGKLPIYLAAAAIICLVGGGIIWKLHSPPEKSTFLQPPELKLTPTNAPPVTPPVAAAMAAAPTITPDGGDYKDTVSVALASVTPGATIYYTVDGSDPATSSTRYNGNFELTNTATVKARAVASGQKDSAIGSATFTVTATPVVGAPTITPDGGGYKDTVSVALASVTPGATIYYTVDGSDPATSSTRYNGNFELTNTATVKARAVASGQKDSAIGSATFTVTATPVVGAPTITPDGGGYKDTVSVALASATPGATVYYTVDGSEPTASSLRYSGPFALTNTATVKARAFASGQKDSAIGSATFTVTATPVVGAPTITPDGGGYKDTVSVALASVTPGATIYYTVDGSDPATSSTRYNGNFELTNTATVKARAVASGQKDSAIGSATFTVTATPVVGAPTITPDGGGYKDTVSVALASATPGATVYYTVDGSEPTASSLRYSGPFALTNTATVKARAVASGQKDSAIGSATFTVTATPVVGAPTITPDGGDYKDTVSVALASVTPGATIYYTVDGSDPATSSTRYNGNFELTNTATVKARAVASGQKDSAIGSATFTVTATPVVGAPTITPDGGGYKDTVSVALASVTPGATIYYTVDGSDPATSSTRYNGNFELTNTATVKARAVASGQKDSAIGSATFTVTATPVVGAPTITPDGGGYKDTVSVALASATPGATVYYTVDGSEPTASSLRYSGPFALTNTATVKARAFANGQKDSLTTSSSFNVTATPLEAIAPPNLEVEAGKSKDITLNGSGPSGAKLDYKVEMNPSRGQLGDLNGGVLVYTANLDASGPDSFTFKVSNEGNYSAPATVQISITESSERRLQREGLDKRLSQLEDYYKPWKIAQEIDFKAADYIANQAVLLENEYKKNGWLSKDRQGRLDKIKSDDRLKDAFNEARRKVSK